MTRTTTDAPRPRRRAAQRAAAVFGSLCVLAAAWLLLVTVRGALDREDAFRSAPACASDSAGRGADCRWTVPARIDRTERVKGKKTPWYWMYVTEADGTSTRTRLKGTAQEAPAATPGRQVEVTYWRGQIRYVDFDAVRRPTNADPRGDYRLPLTFGLGLAFYGAGLLWIPYWQARHARRTVRAYPWQIGVPLTGSLCLAGLGALAPWPTGSPAEAFRLVGLGAPVVVAGCAVAALVWRRRQRGDDTIAVTPKVPATEQRFPGVILGETPYAGRGGLLLAGPARLASTPDPTGTAFRREVPPTLIPLRVRPPYRTDPDDRPDYNGRVLVLECDDDGVPVLIATHRKHMPWVLGALTPTGVRPGGRP